MCVSASNQPWYGCLNVCLAPSTKFPVDSYFCVYVMKAFLKLLKRGAPQRVCVFVHARSSVVWLCVCHLHSPVNSTCVCMYVYYVNTVERLRLQKTVILLIIMKYFILKIVAYFHTTTPCNLINK